LPLKPTLRGSPLKLVAETHKLRVPKPTIRSHKIFFPPFSQVFLVLALPLSQAEEVWWMGNLFWKVIRTHQRNASNFKVKSRLYLKKESSP